MSGMEKIALFIDGANVHATSKALGFDIDWKKLLEVYNSSPYYLVRAFYYTAMLDNEEQHQSIKPLIDWLGYNGYSCVTKSAKEFITPQGNKKIKGNMDVELVVDAIDMSDKIDHMFLFSGDGDFAYMVKAVQRRGVRVSVVSSFKTRPAMIADELRKQADQFVELSDLQMKIGRSEEDRRKRLRL